jgi:hypothetical protein
MSILDTPANRCVCLLYWLVEKNNGEVCKNLTLKNILSLYALMLLTSSDLQELLFHSHMISGSGGTNFLRVGAGLEVKNILGVHSGV